MFVFIMILGVIIVVFFVNDGVILILMFIVLVMIRNLGFNKKLVFFFIIVCGFIVYFILLLFVVSNLVNIVLVDYFGIEFVEYLKCMFIFNLFFLLVSILILWFYFRKFIFKIFDILSIFEFKNVIWDIWLFKILWIILVLLFIGYLVSEFIF